MKKTEWIEILHNIKSTIVSFIAIILFIALAVGLFLGIRWTIVALSLSLEGEYDDGNMYSFKVESNIGIPDSTLEEIKELPYVDEVESFNETYRFFTYNNNYYQAKVLLITNEMNTPLRVTGSLPVKDGEAAIDSHFAYENGVNIGDILNLNENQFVVPGGLNSKKVKITAMIDTAEYLGKYDDTNGFSYASYANVNAILYLPEVSFNKNVFYTNFNLYIKSDYLDNFDTLSIKYENESARIKEEIATTINNSLSKYYNISESDAKTNYAITERNNNASLFGFKCVRDTFKKMQYSLVMLFIIIAILVCYGSLSRIVYDQIKLIGMKKAQGFSSFRIFLSFAIYAFFTSIIGLISGTIIAYFVVEPITVNSVKQTFLFGTTITYFNLTDVLLFSLIIIALIFLTVFVACFRITSKKAYNLLSGEEKPRKYHNFIDKFILTKNLSTYAKSAINGIYDNKRRVIATIIGVIGSTALVTSALTMYLNLDKSFKINFNGIVNYDKTILFENPGIENKIENVLQKNNYKYTKTLYTQGISTLDNNENIMTTIYVVNDDSFYDLLNIQGENSPLKDGVYVNKAYAKNNHKEIGDTIKYTDALGVSHKFVIDGIYDYYLMNYQIIMNKETFENNFNGRSYETNMFLIDTNDDDFENFKNKFNNIDGITSINDYYSSQKNLYDGILIIAEALTVVYLLLSIILAVFILLNLYTMFVYEKKREVITLMINGFDRKRIEKYFYIDSIVLTIIGIILGTIIGVINGKSSLNSFNNSATYFITEINLPACIIGCAFSLALSLIICKISLRKLKKFKCSDINDI